MSCTWKSRGRGGSTGYYIGYGDAQLCAIPGRMTIQIKDSLSRSITAAHAYRTEDGRKECSQNDLSGAKMPNCV